MPVQTLKIEVNPDVLRYFREEAGWSVAEIASQLKTTPAKVSHWESGSEMISIRDLERYAKCVKRPLAAFFLPSPPSAPPVPTDFRMLPGEKPSFSKPARLALRRARRLQTLAAELMNGSSRSNSVVGSASLSDDPEKMAIASRKNLGVDLKTQLTWEKPGEAFSSWRTALEKCSIVVFQMKLPPSDARGFSFAESGPPVVVVSSQDSLTARIFTLWHEYGHLLLRRSGICIPEFDASGDKMSNRIEKWCNLFSAAFLLPQDALAADEGMKELAQGPIEEGAVLKLGNRLKVSREVVVIRLWTLKLISKEECTALYSKLRTKTAKSTRTARFAEHPAKACLQEKGKLLTSLVLQRMHENRISELEAAETLSLRVKYFDRLESLL